MYVIHKLSLVVFVITYIFVFLNTFVETFFIIYLLIFQRLMWWIKAIQNVFPIISVFCFSHSKFIIKQVGKLQNPNNLKSLGYLLGKPKKEGEEAGKEGFCCLVFFLSFGPEVKVKFCHRQSYLRDTKKESRGKLQNTNNLKSLGYLLRKPKKEGEEAGKEGCCCLVFSIDFSPCQNTALVN